jgi:hypothetical protein
MDTLKYKAWRDEKLQQAKKDEEKRKQEAEAKLSAHEDAREREGDEAKFFFAPAPSTEVEADTAANHTDATISAIASTEAFVQTSTIIALTTDSKLRMVSPEKGKDDVAPPMLDSAYYAILGYVVAHTIKTKFLFLFLPCKENI